MIKIKWRGSDLRTGVFAGIPDPVLHTLHAWPLLLRWSRADQTLVIYSFVMSTERREKRGIMSGEKHFNMTKPAPGAPRSSSQIMSRFPFFSADPLFFLFTCHLLLAPSSPLWPSNANSPFTALIFMTCFHPLLNMRLRTGGGLNAASHIGLASINGQITSLLAWVKSKHSSMSIHEGALAFKRRVALGSIKMNRDWLMCEGVISTDAIQNFVICCGLKCSGHKCVHAFTTNLNWRLRWLLWKLCSEPF